MTTRPNWGWGEKDPVPMFTEAEIREALRHFGYAHLEVTRIIDWLKEQREQRIRDITPTD